MISISVKQRSSKRERASDAEPNFEHSSRKSKRISESESDGTYIATYVANYIVDNSYVIVANKTLHMCVDKHMHPHVLYE